MPTFESGEKTDKTAAAKLAAAKALFTQYDSAMAEAEEKQSSALLDRAERILNRIEKIQLAKTVAEVEALLAEQGMSFLAVAKEQTKALKARRGLDLEFKPAEPEITQEQLDVFHDMFGEKNLEPMILPTPEQFNEKYMDALYPPKETADDKAKGIINHYPEWWDKESSERYKTKQRETWGKVFVHSMQAELQMRQKASPGENPVILLESVRKPNYISGNQHYGSTEGTDPTLDPLLPIIQEVFGEDATRFNHSHDELVNQLIPRVKEKIIAKLKSQGLAIPSFDVILAPAVACNLQTVLNHPENSQTNTWELSSDILLDKDGKDSGSRLDVGSAGHGGAGGVNDAHRGAHGGGRGFRLAVVLEK